MFKIGDFSKLSRVSVKTLRFYDEKGLLKPRGVDRFTRYRYYELDQLPTLYRILGLKELGFSLEQIGRLLEGELSPEQLKRMLQKRRMEIARQIDHEQAQLRRVETRLRDIELEGKLSEYEIIIKVLESTWVAAVSDSIPGYEQSEPIFDQLFDEVYAYVYRQGVRNPGCGLAIYHEPPGNGETMKVEAAVQLGAALPAEEPVRVYSLPGYARAASVVHHGPFAEIGKAYQAILAWIEVNDYRICAPTRELYLSYQRGGDQNQFVTEIQIPVIKKEKMMQPKIVQMDKILVVGMPYVGKNENAEIGEMWGRFMPRIGEISDLAPDAKISYGVCYADPQGMEYIAAVPVTALGQAPEGMVSKEVPAQTYAVFEAHGLGDIGPTYHQIMQEWLPTSGYVAGGGPDLEYYPETFNAEDAQSVLYIYFPIKTA